MLDVTSVRVGGVAYGIQKLGGWVFRWALLGVSWEILILWDFFALGVTRGSVGN